MFFNIRTISNVAAGEQISISYSGEIKIFSIHYIPFYLK